MKKQITIKTRFGNYRSFEKTFSDERHFDNWYRVMSENGTKIIGCFSVKQKTEQL